MYNKHNHDLRKSSEGLLLNVHLHIYVISTEIAISRIVRSTETNSQYLLAARFLFFILASLLCHTLERCFLHCVKTSIQVFLKAGRIVSERRYTDRNTMNHRRIPYIFLTIKPVKLATVPGAIKTYLLHYAKWVVFFKWYFTKGHFTVSNVTVWKRIWKNLAPKWIETKQPNVRQSLLFPLGLKQFYQQNLILNKSIIITSCNAILHNFTVVQYCIAPK